jgi:hypothetical protein
MGVILNALEDGGEMVAISIAAAIALTARLPNPVPEE